MAPRASQAEVHRLKHTSSLGNPMVTQLAVADFLATGAMSDTCGACGAPTRSW